MGMREDFEKWAAEAGYKVDRTSGGYKYSLTHQAWQYWQIRQPEIDALKAELKHWKSNHENMVNRSRVLMERTDLPLERVQAFNQIGELQAEVAHLNGRLIDEILARQEQDAEVARLKADAERYVWLKANCFDFEEPCDAYAAGVLHFESTELTQLPDSLDGVIDAAMKDFSTTQ